VIVDSGLEISLLGAIARVQTSLNADDAGKILTATKDLHDLFAEADRMKLAGTDRLAQQALDMIGQALIRLDAASVSRGAGAATDARATYRTVERLSL
jgi:hypothetical protein